MGFYMNIALFPPLLGLIGMIAAFVVYMLVMKYPDGEDKVIEDIVMAIQWGLI